MTASPTLRFCNCWKNVTGDEIDPASKLMGSTLYWGPIGAVTSLVDVMIEFSTGKDIGGHTLNIIKGDHTNVKRTAHDSEPNNLKKPTLPNNLDWVLSTKKTAAKRSDYGIVTIPKGNDIHMEQRPSYYSLQQVLLEKLQPETHGKDGTDPQSKRKLQIKKIAGAYEQISHL